MAKKIKLLITISNFNTAGSGKVVYDLVNELDKTKYDIDIACGSNEGSFFPVIESLGVPIHIFETKTSYKPYYNLLFRVWKISKFYKSHQYDIIHSWQWSNDWTEALAAKLVGVKWIYTKKAMGFKSKHWHIKSYLADFIITINDKMRDYFPKKRAQALIPLGIDTHYYSPESIEEVKNKNSRKFNVVTIANLVPVKGIEILIRAVQQLNDIEVSLSIIGDCDNDYGDQMKALTNSLGITDQVDFLGKKLDVRPYFKSADLYVIPTLDEGRKEGMPMALVEAMSMAVPVLGSDITGINYVLREFSHLLFKPGNVDDLMLKLSEFKTMTPENRNSLGADLRQYCINNFTMDAFISAHEDLYEQIVNG